ncbi:MAG: hypothetical protein KDE31_25780, partial [Caldilineaceae bacterium]|nr:hypothetical protein [Caldilineaceae bacterium]
MAPPFYNIVATVVDRLNPLCHRLSCRLTLHTLTLHAWVDALERGRWRDWIGVAVGQFLSLYAWKGVLYPLLGVNLVVAALMLTKLRGTGRQITVGRWLAVNCMSGGIFVPLVALAQV